MPRLSRVSFDYDDTLEEEEVYLFALDLLNRGFDVWIITSRPPEVIGDIRNAARNLGVFQEHIVATNLDYKYGIIGSIKPIFHLDNDWTETKLINTRTNTAGILYGFDPDWKINCEIILGPYKDEFGYAKKPTVRAKKPGSKE